MSCWFALAGYANRHKTNSSLTNWRTTHQAKGCSIENVISSSPLLMSLQPFLSSGPKVHYKHKSITSSCALNLDTNTEFLRSPLPQPWASKAPDCKTVKNCIFSLHSPQSSFYFFSGFSLLLFSLQSPSPSRSLYNKLSLRALETAIMWY